MATKKTAAKSTGKVQRSTKQQKPAQEVEVKASDVMAVNEDGTMEPLTEAIPEIEPEETVSFPKETTPPSAAQTPPPEGEARGATINYHLPQQIYNYFPKNPYKNCVFT